MSDNPDGRLFFDTKIDTTGFKQGVGDIAKISGAAITAASAAFAKLTYEAVKGYSETEQLIGGVKTLFGTEAGSVEEYAATVGKSVEAASAEYEKLVRAQDAVTENAENAFKTAGMSANTYMETVTSFSAALIASLDGDTEAAAEKANQAITDMSDNANKMGSDMESIQVAYQGFAKQNYTMLDNLKLGYGGTKTEMERLLADASALSGIEYNIDSYADVIDAINVIQTKMGITGTTAREASKTIQGSIGATKAAFDNLIAGAANSEQSVDKLVNDLVECAKTAADNIMPVVQETVPRLIEGLSQVGSAAIEYFPELVSSMLPSLQSGATELISATVGMLPGILSAVISQFPTFTQEAIPSLIADMGTLIQGVLEAVADDLPSVAVQLVTALADGIGSQAAELIPAGAKCAAKLVTGLLENAPMLVGSAEKLIKGFVDGLIGAVPILVESAPEILMGLADGMLEAAVTLFVDIPNTIFDTIVDGMNDADWDAAWAKWKESCTEAYTRAVDKITERITESDPYHIMSDLSPKAVDFSEFEGKSKSDLERINQQNREEIKQYKDIMSELEDGGIYDYLSDESKQKLINTFGEDNLQNLTYQLTEKIDELYGVEEKINAAWQEQNKPKGFNAAGYEAMNSYAQEQIDKQKQAKNAVNETVEEVKTAAALSEEAIKAEWEEIARLSELGKISEEEALTRRLDFVKKYYPTYTAESHKYYKEIYDDRKAIEEAATKETEDNLENQNKAVKDGLDKIIDSYEEAYKKLEDKRDDYRKRLLAVGGSLFEITTEKDKDGNETKTYEINNIDEQIAKMREYHRYIKQLKEEGASASLLDEINSQGADEGAIFAKNIANMTEEKRKQLYELYNERDTVARELSYDLYADEAQSIQDTFTGALESLAFSAYDAGVTTAEEFAAGFNSAYSLQMEQLKGTAAYEQFSISAASLPTSSDGSSGNGRSTETTVNVEPTEVIIKLDEREVGRGVVKYERYIMRTEGK